MLGRFENPRRGMQARKFNKNCSEIVFRTDIFQKLSLGAPDLISVLFKVTG